VDLRPGAEQHLQALSGLLATGEHDTVLALPGARLRRREDAVRDHLVVTGEP